MPASVCQKLTSATPVNLQETMWSDRGSADGTDIGGTFNCIRVKNDKPNSSVNLILPNNCRAV